MQRPIAYLYRLYSRCLGLHECICPLIILILESLFFLIPSNPSGSCALSASYSTVYSEHWGEESDGDIPFRISILRSFTLCIMPGWGSLNLLLSAERWIFSKDDWEKCWIISIAECHRDIDDISAVLRFHTFKWSLDVSTCIPTSMPLSLPHLRPWFKHHILYIHKHLFYPSS